MQPQYTLEFEHLADQASIYLITNRITGRRYVGQTKRPLKVRLGGHLRDLTSGHHHNKYLQADWHVYGESAFRWSILEIVPLGDSKLREAYWINWHLSLSIWLYNADVRICDWCSARFTQSTPQQRYCTPGHAREERLWVNKMHPPRPRDTAYWQRETRLNRRFVQAVLPMDITPGDG